MTRSITVAPGQSMSEVLNALKIGAGDELVIDIPADASVLLTANEFRALSIAAERDEVEVSIYTEDPLRRQLATLFGVPLVNEIPQPMPYVAPELDPVGETEAFAPAGDDEDRDDDRPPRHSGSTRAMSPRQKTSISIEAGTTRGWARWAAHQHGLDDFGASAPADDLARHFGLTVDAIVDRVRGLA